MRLPHCDQSRAVAFADASRGLVICGGVPGAGQQWKQVWSYDRGDWTKLSDRPSYGYVGTLEALGPQTYVHHSGRANDLMTTDGGRTWLSVLPPESSAVGRWLNAHLGWAFNGHGDVFRTSDGGGHWRHVAPSFWPTSETSFCDPRIGFGRGAPAVGGYSNDGTLYATLDGGRIWRRRSRLPLGASTITCLSRNDVLVGGARSLNTERIVPLLFRSRDGARHWTKLPVPEDAYPPQVLSEHTIVAVKNVRTWYVSRDGARTWTTLRAPQRLESIAFVSRGAAFAVTRTGRPKASVTHLLRTTDGGRSWKAVRSRIAHLRPTAVFAANGTLWVGTPHHLLRSDDAGKHWDDIRHAAFQPIGARFVSARLGTAPGYRGLYVTRDGGVTWQWLRRGGYP